MSLLKMQQLRSKICLWHWQLAAICYEDRFGADDEVKQVLGLCLQLEQGNDYCIAGHQLAVLQVLPLGVTGSRWHQSLVHLLVCCIWLVPAGPPPAAPGDTPRVQLTRSSSCLPPAGAHIRRCPFAADLPSRACRQQLQPQQRARGFVAQGHRLSSGSTAAAGAGAERLGRWVFPCCNCCSQQVKLRIISAAPCLQNCSYTLACERIMPLTHGMNTPVGPPATC